MYYARITATMDHFRIVEGRKICDKIAGQFYLTREEYIAQRLTWCKQDCWDALTTEWSSPKFKERSEKNRQNCLSWRFKPHRGGSNSIAVMRQKMVSVHLLLKIYETVHVVLVIAATHLICGSCYCILRNQGELYLNLRLGSILTEAEILKILLHSTQKKPQHAW